MLSSSGIGHGRSRVRPGGNPERGRGVGARLTNKLAERILADEGVQGLGDDGQLGIGTDGIGDWNACVAAPALLQGAEYIWQKDQVDHVLLTLERYIRQAPGMREERAMAFLSRWSQEERERVYHVPVAYHNEGEAKMSQPIALVLPTPVSLLKLMPTARSRGDIAEVKEQVARALRVQGQRVTAASVATTLRQLPRPSTQEHAVVFLFQTRFRSLRALARTQQWVYVQLIHGRELPMQRYTVSDMLTVTFVLPPPLQEFRSMMSLLEFLNGASLNTQVGFVWQGDDDSEDAQWLKQATYVSQRNNSHTVDCRVPANVSDEACGTMQMGCKQVGGTLLYYYKVFVQKTASVDPDLYRATLAPFALETAGGDAGLEGGLKQMVDVMGSAERCDWWPPEAPLFGELFGEHTRVDLPEGVEEEGGCTKRERDESGEEEDGGGGAAKRAK